LLDIGCASGTFIELLRPRLTTAKFTGIDISAELIGLAAKTFAADTSCSFYVQDGLAHTPKRKYDVIIASGVLSMPEDFAEPHCKWLLTLKARANFVCLVVSTAEI